MLHKKICYESSAVHEFCMAFFFRDVNLLRSLGLKDVYGKIVTKSWGREEGGA